MCGWTTCDLAFSKNAADAADMSEGASGDAVEAAKGGERRFVNQGITRASSQ